MSRTSTVVAGPNGRVAIVDGCRTPFCKAGGELAQHSNLDLATLAVCALAGRNGLKERGPDSVVLGSVHVPADVPYLARQVALDLGWPNVEAYSEECACATGARTVVSGAYQILAGEHQTVIAGGAESLSQRPVEVSPAARNMILGHSKFEHDSLMSLRLQDLLPDAPGTVEPYSGRTLLEHAEDMVRDWHIPRSEEDALSVRSHLNADRAWSEGRFDGEVIPVRLEDGRTVRRDGLVRADTSIGLLAKLVPVQPDGTITAGNASRLTDGASAVLLMSERQVEALGLEPRAWLQAWAFTGQDPKLGALIGPVFALREAFDRAGVELADCDLLDLHEAFAGQVLANLYAMKSADFAKVNLNGSGMIGEIPEEILNVNGGSIALGHPFGATGGRLINQSVNELRRRGGKRAAIGICAGGARGAALVLEAA